MHIKRQECVGLAQSSKMKRKCQFTSFSLVFLYTFHLISIELTNERQNGVALRTKKSIRANECCYKNAEIPRNCNKLA